MFAGESVVGSLRRIVNVKIHDYGNFSVIYFAGAFCFCNFVAH